MQQHTNLQLFNNIFHNFRTSSDALSKMGQHIMVADRGGPHNICPRRGQTWNYHIQGILGLR
jgi:hypothetical protein